MFALSRSLGHLGAALAVVGSAISTAAALRITHPAETSALRKRD